MKSIHKFVFNLLRIALIFSVLLFGCASRHIGGGFPVVINQAPPANAPAGSPDVTPAKLITAFYQGRAGNCAAIAVIKTAMAVFGTTGVYKDDPADPSKKHLHNGKDVILTSGDLDKLGQLDKFVPGTDNAIYQQAKVLYAIIVIQKFDGGHGGYGSLEAAAEALNGGEGQTAKNIIPLLGLTATAPDIDIDKIAKEEHLIVTSYYHAAFSSLGYYDEYGSKTLVSDFKENHRGFWHSSDLSEAYSIDANH